MKKKLKIDILAKGQDLENLVLIVARHNEGNNPVSLEDIASYLWARRSTLDYYKTVDLHGSFEDESNTKLLIKEGEKVFAVIEEIEVYELDGEFLPDLPAIAKQLINQ